MFLAVFLSLFLLHLFPAVVLSGEGGDDATSHLKVIFEQDSISTLGATERLVQNILFLHTGVPVDLSYNETAAPFLSEGSYAVISAPGCPKSVEGRPWLYYGSPAKCYLVGFQGPCPWGQRFFSVEGSKYGVCNCDCFAFPSESQKRPEKESEPDFELGHNLILPRKSSRYRRMYLLTMATGSRKLSYHSNSFSSRKRSTFPGQRYHFCQSPSFKRLVVYDSLRQECTPVLEQGPCDEGEWLGKDPTTDSGILCERRKCPPFYKAGIEDGGGFNYFDYRTQECLTEVYGSLQSSFFSTSGGILSSRYRFCRDAGLKYSPTLKTCIKDNSQFLNFNLIG